MIIKTEKCQKTMTHDIVSGDWRTCNRNATHVIPKKYAFAGKRYVCGVHARQYNNLAKKNGWPEAKNL